MDKLDDLLKQQENLAVEIDLVKKEQREEVLVKVRKLVKQYGITATELKGTLKVKKKRKSAVKKAAVKK